MEENKIRINKFLASKGLASRRQVDLWIEEGKILVNGSLATSGQKVSEEDEIIVNGKSFSGKKETKVYYLLYKEEEVLSAVKDDRGRRTVIDCIPTPYRIFPVGRLDYRTSGLILLTNDGELFNRIMHPRAEIFKSYEVLAKGHLTKQDRKSTRLNSSHANISYAVFCLKKNKTTHVSHDHACIIYRRSLCAVTLSSNVFYFIGFTKS